MAVPDRMTVLHVVPEDSFRGAQVYAGRLRDALADDPEQQHIVVSLFRSRGGAMHPDVTLGHGSGRLRRAGLDPRVAVHLRRTLRTLGADVVVAHGGEALKYLVPAHGRAPIVYYKVGLSSAELARPSRLRLYRALVRHVALGVGVSTAVRDQMRDVLGMPPARLTVIPNGRPPEIYYPAESDALPTKRPLVLWVGQFEAGKRPRLFLEAIEQLRDRGLDFDAAMAGDGPLRNSLEPIARRAQVDLLGVRDDIPELLRSAAALVMTSAPDTEGMPGVLIEAALTGVPVLTTNSAGACDVVHHETTGYIIGDEHDHVTISEHLFRLLPDTELRSSLGRAALKRATTNFTTESSARSWQELIEINSGAWMGAETS